MQSICLHPPSQCGHPLTQAREPQAVACGFAACQFAWSSVVEDLSRNRAMLLDQPNETGLSAAVSDDIGHAFAHCPGEDGVYGSGKGLEKGFDSGIDPSGGEQLACSLQFAFQVRLSIARNGLAD